MSDQHPDPRQSYDLGPYVDEHYVLLRHCLDTLTLYYPNHGGIALEFGVGVGTSMRQIAMHVHVIGFDSFKGLPEDWRPGYPTGAFACDPPIDIPGQIVIGNFEDTLPDFIPTITEPISLIHIDCDLYSSTDTVLKHVGPHLNPGCFIIFDEWHGYEGCEEHEQRAWREFAEETGVKWDVVGHSFEQWAIRVV